jgi:hypothetical protein
VRRTSSVVDQAIVKMEKDRRHRHSADDTSMDALLSTLEGPDYVPDVSVDSEWAALHLGICQRTLWKYRKMGIVRAFGVRVGQVRKISWRYLMSDLDEFIQKHRNLKRYWDPEEDAELPVAVVARFLNVTAGTVHVLRCRGKLKDYRPESVRDYLLTHSRKTDAVAGRSVGRRATRDQL